MMSIYHASDALNKAFAMFFISALLDFLGIEYGSIEVYPTEIIKDNERRFMDYAVIIDASYVINLEFHDGNLGEDELNRFLKYKGDTRLKSKMYVYTYIICTGNPNKSVKEYILNNKLEYAPEIVFLSLENADEKIELIREKIKNKEKLTKREKAFLVYIPFMSSSFAKEELVRNTCLLTMQLNTITEKERNRLRRCQYLLIDIFVDDDNKNEFREIIKMTGSYTSQCIENIKNEGRIEGKLEVIKNLASEMTVKKIAQIVELDEEDVAKIIEENDF